MGLIEIRDLYKIYHEGLENEVRALDGVSLSIDCGEFVAIVGASGSGKVHHDEHSGLSGHPHPGGNTCWMTFPWPAAASGSWRRSAAGRSALFSRATT